MHDRINFNTQERLISNDLKQLQLKRAVDLAELERARSLVHRLDYYGRPGVHDAAARSYWLDAVVFTGLLVRPTTNAYLTVDPGAIGAARAAYSLETGDSDFVVARSPGLSTPGALAFTANGGGSARWDLVECRIVDTLVASEIREIYNPATEIGDPTMVEKVRTPTVEFRIRVGTAGAGLPAADAEWRPLAVVFVLPGASGFDQCDLYDVRPLAEERVVTFGRDPAPPAIETGQAAFVEDGELYVATGASTSVDGWCDAVLNGWRAGGEIQRSTPASSLANFGSGSGPSGGDAAQLFVSETDNKMVGFAFSGQTIWHVVAVFPWGLPRWVRYQESGGSAREPRGPRGILLASTATPNANGVLPGVMMPAYMALPGPHTGVVLASFTSSSGGPAFARGIAQGRGVTVENMQLPTGSAYLGSNIDWVLVPGVDYPVTARRIRVGVQLAYTPGSDSEAGVLVQQGLGSGAGFVQIGAVVASVRGFAKNALSKTLTVEAWIDVPPTSGRKAASRYSVTVRAAATFNPSSHFLNLIGYSR